MSLIKLLNEVYNQWGKVEYSLSLIEAGGDKRKREGEEDNDVEEVPAVPDIEPISFDNLREEALYNLLEFLSLKDLKNVSETNKDLARLARRLMFSKYTFTFNKRLIINEELRNYIQHLFIKDTWDFYAFRRFFENEDTLLKEVFPEIKSLILNKGLNWDLNEDDKSFDVPRGIVNFKVNYEASDEDDCLSVLLPESVVNVDSKSGRMKMNFETPGNIKKLISERSIEIHLKYFKNLEILSINIPHGDVIKKLPSKLRDLTLINDDDDDNEEETIRPTDNILDINKLPDSLENIKFVYCNFETEITRLPSMLTKLMLYESQIKLHYKFVLPNTITNLSVIRSTLDLSHIPKFLTTLFVDNLDDVTEDLPETLIHFGFINASVYREFPPNLIKLEFQTCFVIKHLPETLQEIQQSNAMLGIRFEKQIMKLPNNLRKFGALTCNAKLILPDTLEKIVILMYDTSKEILLGPNITYAAFPMNATVRWDNYALEETIEGQTRIFKQRK